MDISIITATYNSADTLLKCLESVAKQNISLQHLIIDGCSTDGTLDIVKKYRGYALKILSEPDDGLYDAMNKGIRHADGDIVGILNGDDYYADAYVLKDVIKKFSDTRVDACYGDLCYVDPHDTNKIVRYWKSGNYSYKKFYWGWMPPHPTFFVRKSLYNQFGTFDLSMESAADYELMLRFLVKHRVHTEYIPRVLVNMRTGGVSNASFNNRLSANRKDRHAWRVNGLTPFPWSLALKPVRKIGQWFRRPVN